MEKYDKIFNKCAKEAYEGVLYIKSGNDELSFNAQYGMDLDKKFAIGGVTKLFTAACIFKLIENKKLILDSKVGTYLDVSRLCVVKGFDYTGEITIRNLLFQTSGIADYFENIVKTRLYKADFKYNFNDAVIMTKELKAIDKPGKTTSYSEMNFDILGAIIEKVTGKELYKTFKEFIFTPLGLKNTYMPIDETLIIPPVYYNNKPLKRSGYIVSSKASGGIISTTRELMIFLKAFFTGQLFDIQFLDKLKEYSQVQTIYGGVLYGGGLMRLKTKGEVIGHFGYTGAFAFYDVEKDLYFVGSLSQINVPTLSLRLLVELIEKG